jgi:hypothetical protein
MDKNMKKSKSYLLALVTISLMSSVSAFAEESVLKVKCQADADKLYRNQTIKTEQSEEREFELKPRQGNSQFKDTNGVLALSDGYEIVFKLVHVQGDSNIINGADTLVAFSRLQRKNKDGSITALASSTNSSDNISDLRFIDMMKKALYVRASFSNPELDTAALNAGDGTSHFDVVERGLAPEGVVSSATFHCDYSVKQ